MGWGGSALAAIHILRYNRSIRPSVRKKLPLSEQDRLYTNNKRRLNYIELGPEELEVLKRRISAKAKKARRYVLLLTFSICLGMLALVIMLIYL